MIVKDYRVIAAVLSSRRMSLKTNDFIRLVDDFCLALKTDNPRFNIERFRKACGL